jgi:hypothetical protein
MKKLILVTVLAGIIATMAGCGNSQPTLTKEQTQALDQLQQMQEAGKKVQENQAKQVKVLQSMLDNATIKDVTVDGEKQTEYTFTNTTGSDVQFFQLAWDALDANGNKLFEDYSSVSGVVKAGDVFKLNARCAMDVKSYKVTKLNSSGEWTVK